MTRPDSAESEQPAASSQWRNERPPPRLDDASDSEITETEALHLLKLIQDNRRRDDRQATDSGQH